MNESADAILRTGDIVYAYAETKEADSGLFHPLRRFALLSSSSFVVAPRVLMQEPIWIRDDNVRVLACQPLLLQAALDAMPYFPQEVSFLPPGEVITSAHLIFLELAQDFSTTSLFFTPRPSSVGLHLSPHAFSVTPGLNHQAVSMFVSFENFPPRSVGLNVVMGPTDRYLVSGKPFDLTSHFGKFRLTSAAGTTIGAEDANSIPANVVATGFVDSNVRFFFRKYKQAFQPNADGCEMISAQDVAQSPLFCNEAGQKCKFAGGDLLFWSSSECQHYLEQNNDPGDKGQSE